MNAAKKALVFKDFHEFLKAGAFFFHQIQRGDENNEGKKSVSSFANNDHSLQTGIINPVLTTG